MRSPIPIQRLGIEQLMRFLPCQQHQNRRRQSVQIAVGIDDSHLHLFGGGIAEFADARRGGGSVVSLSEQRLYGGCDFLDSAKVNQHRHPVRQAQNQVIRGDVAVQHSQRVNVFEHWQNLD